MLSNRNWSIWSGQCVSTMVHLLNARYWQRRVLEVKCGYELTAQQGVRIERMLKQLASRPG